MYDKVVLLYGKQYTTSWRASVTCSLQSFQVVCYPILTIMVKSGNFGHQVNSNLHLQTVETKMRRLLSLFA